MTLDKLLSMPAGRALDAEVSKAMGREVEWRDVLEGHQPFSRLDDWPDGSPSWVWCPNYSTMIQHAWPLLAEMLEAGMRLKFMVNSDGGLVLDCFVSGDDLCVVTSNAKNAEPLRIEFKRHEFSVPSVDDAALAICRAWLAWKAQPPGVTPPWRDVP